jgi:hypothetical protein
VWVHFDIEDRGTLVHRYMSGPSIKSATINAGCESQVLSDTASVQHSSEAEGYGMLPFITSFERVEDPEEFSSATAASNNLRYRIAVFNEKYKYFTDTTEKLIDHLKAKQELFKVRKVVFRSRSRSKDSWLAISSSLF